MKSKDIFVECRACPPFLLGQGEVLKKSGSREEGVMLTAEASIGLISS